MLAAILSFIGLLIAYNFLSKKNIFN